MRVISNELHGDPNAAAQIREIADLVESGAVRDIVIVYDNRKEKHLASWGEFSDRWRLLGAIEYAKKHIFNGMG